MFAKIAADAVVVVHLLFILFVVFGAFLVERWPKMAWLHLPAVLWGMGIEWSGLICPLTPIENMLRNAAGDQGYAGGFIEQYLMPVVYPVGLTRHVQVMLGIAVMGVNLVLYGRIVARWKAGRSTRR